MEKMCLYTHIHTHELKQTMSTVLTIKIKMFNAKHQTKTMFKARILPTFIKLFSMQAENCFKFLLFLQNYFLKKKPTKMFFKSYI